MKPEDASIEILLSVVDDYMSRGRQLFPLHHKSKVPFETGWTSKDYTLAQLRKYVRRGLNLGWRLGPADLVIDVDPRDPGATRSEGILKSKLKLASCPVVWTGRRDGGKHYYAEIPSGVKLRSKHEDYKGIDFKKHGGFVLVPGCLHDETGQLYSADPLAPTEPCLFSTEDLSFLEYQDRGWSPDQSMTLDEIRAYLQKIPTTHYRDYHEWLKIGMAIHAASDGSAEGEELWVSWSIRDPEYADAEGAARGKWASFHDRIEGVTGATLVHAAMTSGPSTILSAELAFKDVPFTVSPSVQDFDSFLAGLGRRDPPQLTEAIARAQRFGLDCWDDVRRALKQYYGASLTTIDAAWRKCEREKTQKERKEKKERDEKKLNDSAIKVAKTVIESRFHDGQHILHADNQQFYQFIGTHWVRLLDNVIKKHIFEVAEELVVEDPKSKIKPSSVFTPAEQVLIALTAREEDVFKFRGPMRSVINTKNAEIWIQADGTYEVQGHSPDSYLLTCLDTEYDPEAQCPLMDEALRGIFRDNKDPDEMVRHLWEFAGYVIQPRKNIPAWFLWTGAGSNGKTVVAEIIAGLMGDAVLPRPLEVLGNVSNSHASTSLVGKLLLLDDDASTNAKLPESALKKLAESKDVEANPKKKDAFVFKACATPLLLVNGQPPTGDLSHGMLRKVYFFPFERRFTEAEQDISLGEKILSSELPGVLNRALAGYQRLRRRGQFLVPTECLDAKRSWLREANPLVNFLASKIQMSGNGAQLSLDELYGDYRLWCEVTGGVNRPLAQHRFAAALRTLNYRVEDNHILGIERREMN